MTDRFRTYDSECGVNGAGDRHHWPTAFGAPRRPNKKFTTVRRPVARGDEGPEIRKPGNGMLLSSSSSSSPSPSLSSLSSPSTSSAPSTHCHYEPFRRPNPNNVETCEAIEWEVMSKHFARLPPFIKEKNAKQFNNGHPQTKIPQHHHLQYYSDLHKLHQVAYATRNTNARKPMAIAAAHQPCCKPWQWSPYGGPAGTFMNAYYLSEPQRYDNHAKNVILEDSLIKVDETDKLSSEVWHTYLDNRQSEGVYETKMTMWRRLSALIKSWAPGCGLYLVGSTMNGFGGDVSDADFCLLTGCTAAAGVNAGVRQHRTVTEERHRICAVERLQWLMGLLNHERINGKVGTAEMRIVYAKVPILRFRWIGAGDDKMDVDFCCNNVVGIRNTHLLYCYSRLDYRVRPLVVTIKLWASRHNINDPKKMTLSSYSLVLMVINFLQSVEPPVLPSLQCIYGMKFSANTDIEFVHMHEQLPSSGWRSDNKQSLGELLLQFFEYYNDFNFYKYAVSVRMGSPILLESCRMADAAKNNPGQWKFIGIEEPFERTNTARSVNNHNVFAQIKEAISNSYNHLKETMSLD
ncbi:poly(A) RNA polymerase gld-2 homolog A-like [Rhopalosiphum maidis]|uniref:poly(A) RNA polymerase gld-2 homolog A-like n=1 Tax=Rhopalosiphum maidis TaxID=43146 RepID=UPI000EFDF446|nr:poly(A) RNA polymerase gld-2 homolog A-like [Rhopalosiphum maidis]